MTPTLYEILSILFVIIAVLLILVILVQRGRGGGLVGAFGGPGGSSAFGAKTGDVFTVITVVMAALFLIVACLLAFRPSLVTPVRRPPTPVESTTDGTVRPKGPAPQPAAIPDTQPADTDEQEKKHPMNNDI